jgi:predicted site-specific integrase-resolvase
LGYSLRMKLSASAKQVGVTYKTAHAWWKAGQLDAFHLLSGTILVRETTPRAAGVALSARVSSAAQQDDLTRQLHQEGRRVEVISPSETGTELVDDCVAVITSMAARISGRRNAKRRAAQMQACVKRCVEQAEQGADT